jgi:iron complex outermembrane receptor protein
MRIPSAFLVCLLVSASAAAQTVSGVVRDPTGAVISGASVIIRTPAGVDRQTTTDPDGSFSVDGGIPADAELVVRSVGFAEHVERVSARGGIDIVLQPAGVRETIAVTPTRTEQRLGDVAASVNVVDKEMIRRSPAVVADDVLRLVPTFSLFRRTSSLAAHPTAQGVSLRGIGPSGVSRTLVMIDGVPFNDPFGGWVYWTRVPLESVERVEVVDGTSSSVYGNYAMGGVINVVSTRPRPRTFEFRTQGGNRGTGKADFFASDVWGKFGASLEGSFFGTNGFPIVVADERGPIDTKATVDYTNLAFKVDYSPSQRLSAFLRVGYFREERDNAKFSTFDGTPEANDTLWKSVSGGVRMSLPDQSDLQARVFVDLERFHSNFLAVPNLTTRAIGRMSLRQRVPTTGVGGMVQWAKAVTGRTLFTAGADWRRVEGASEEQALDQATGLNVVTLRESGGTQQSSGAFVQGQFWPVQKLSVTLSGRVDHWRNYEGRNLETSVATGLPTANNRLLPDADETVFSPRGAALYHVNDRVSAWGSIGSGFRAPTLNELYRQFRVGALLTLANDQLGPERLVGGELGVNLAPVDNLTVRVTWFDNRVKNPVSNVTLPTPANTQQRQNLGRTRIRGIQTDVEYRIAPDWRVGAGYVYNDATVTEFDANPALVGKTLPQVPDNRGSITFAYSNDRVATLAVSAMFFGRQFNEDLNTGTVPGRSEPGLPAYGTLEFSASRAIGRNLDVFFGVQNLFDEEYYVGLSPTTIGSPRLVNGGVRVRFAGR